jgi:hypothetical protein
LTVRPATFALLAVIILLTGCGGEHPRVETREVSGVEAIPAGYALLVEGRNLDGTQGPEQKVEALIVPEEGLFRIELLGEATPAEMLITIRSPEKQLGLRAQAVLEGEPHPLSMAFLCSPLVYPTPAIVFEELRWEGNRCEGILRIVGSAGSSSTDRGTYEAEVDPETNIVIWERQSWTPYPWMGMEITRRFVPLDEVEIPRVDEVLARAQEEWMGLLEEANDGAYPVFGLDLEGLVLHTLQLYEGQAWVRYSSAAQPGRIAAEMYEGQSSTEEPLSEQERADLEGDWQPCLGEEGQTPGWRHQFFRTAVSPRTGEAHTRTVELTVYDWALEELGVTLSDVEKALRPLELPERLGDIRPPHLVFEGRMPLPSGADFGGMLSREYLLYGR